MHDVVSLQDITSYDEIESNVNIPVLLKFIKLVAKLMKCSANVAFYLFSSTCLIS